ncbi:hypothetical protein, partial [Aeromonas veronii]|uniref:hypothetical protein n=1 Tax=Aeromonas veronii TaxID=654 RepID=UPI001FD3D136
LSDRHGCYYVIGMNVIERSPCVGICTYITNEILRGEPLAHIAAQVGNSVKMIERHYSHATMRRIRTAELDRNKKDK